MNFLCTVAALVFIILTIAPLRAHAGGDSRRPSLKEPLVSPLPKIIYIAAKDANNPSFQALREKQLKEVELRRGDQVEEPFKRATLKRDAAYSELFRYPFDLIPKRGKSDRLSSRVVVGILADETGRVTGAWVLEADDEPIAKHVIRKLGKISLKPATLAERPVPSILIQEMEYGLR